jgi:hypothetical protein
MCYHRSCLLETYKLTKGVFNTTKFKMVPYIYYEVFFLDEFNTRSPSYNLKRIDNLKH